jgi:hypothetical protein
MGWVLVRTSVEVSKEWEGVVTDLRAGGGGEVAVLAVLGNCGGTEAESGGGSGRKMAMDLREGDGGGVDVGRVLAVVLRNGGTGVGGEGGEAVEAGENKGGGK